MIIIIIMSLHSEGGGGGGERKPKNFPLGGEVNLRASTISSINGTAYHREPDQSACNIFT